MDRTRSISREIGTAFAVLAIYLLTVLAPLHHARASQLAFEELGYASAETGWVLCTPGDAGDERDGLTVAKCPATGVGKVELVLPASAAVPAHIDVAALPGPLVKSAAVQPRAVAPPGGPRGPPVLA